jgi:hypothetical protein
MQQVSSYKKSFSKDVKADVKGQLHNRVNPYEVESKTYYKKLARLLIVNNNKPGGSIAATYY